MEWLHSFAALSLCCGVAAALLPEGSLRRTAALVLGLVLTLCWVEGLCGMAGLGALPDAASSVLAETGFRADDAYAECVRALEAAAEDGR